MAERKYWLFKSEPGTYSFSDLMGEPDGTAEWDGVRNYQARNTMRDDIKVGDAVLFQHSGATPSVVGTARVVREGYPDPTALDPAEKHYDSKSTPDNPTWFMVDIKAEEEFRRPVPLAEIKGDPRLKNMMLVRPGARLSVQPVSADEWNVIVELGGAQSA